MKSLKSGIIAGLLVSGLATADSSSEVGIALSAWAPDSVSEQGARTTVVLDEGTVTTQIYTQAISNGVCARVWLKQASSGYLAGITEIAVVNKSQRQGFIMEGGKEICDDLGLIPSSKIPEALAAKTRSL
ncbi:hypothetical protein LCG56_27380 (plasmid) [Pseudomonas cannabina pv. alisalensis]|uniref:Lipoprotein n=1 Tax=Pseudomonas syringae pv. maculicola str. ES4326 TaxID=629265 RepID=A0A8T8CAD4_PSEYM|nr:MULTISPECIES: hypothetical protein [Pseudomonas syringae group]QHF00509.1 hypothetical protein PMA4326_028760 [Pseudomonas syringae pv. maculicola str. ES4326]UBZ00488.1 hypothetical protein LCG56_27380 [Pseudomonas cannabina pv. alisalensis]